MTATDICSDLYSFDPLTSVLHQYAASLIPKDTIVHKSISSTYDFITIDLNKNEELFIRVKFERKTTEVKINEIYCADSSQTSAIENLVKAHMKSSSVVSTFPYSEEIRRYLNIADSIAACAHNCTSGDNYHPGYFSKIRIDDEQIVLSQVNYMNSKSLAHKTDYSLRKLEFTIPFHSSVKKNSFYDDNIGEMKIEFSDNSSENNKHCGDSILKQIESEKATYLK